MYHFYSYNTEQFMAHYHKRSNVETTFHMIKAKFGIALRSKTKTAQINEALCKVLCHNICCLIQSIFELGIEPTFWSES
jgi:transposase